MGKRNRFRFGIVAVLVTAAGAMPAHAGPQIPDTPPNVTALPCLVAPDNPDCFGPTQDDVKQTVNDTLDQSTMAEWELEHEGVLTVAVPSAPMTPMPQDVVPGSHCKDVSLTLEWQDVFGLNLASYTGHLHWCWTVTNTTSYITSSHGWGTGTASRGWQYDGSTDEYDYNDTGEGYWGGQGHFKLEAFGITWQEWDPEITLFGKTDGSWGGSYSS